MKQIQFILLILIVKISNCQNLDSIQHAILNEGLEIYKLERIAWFGTDQVLDDSPINMYLFNGYLPYRDSNYYRCIFYDHDSFDTKIRFTISHPISDSISSNSVEFDNNDRVPTTQEMRFIIIREDILNNIKDSKLVQYNPELIGYNISFVQNKEIVKCYFLPGTKVDSVFFLGGDFIFNYSLSGDLIEILPQHKTLIPIRRLKEKNVNIIHHSHLESFSPYITPTDICQIKLYSKMTVGCTKHEVISQFYTSKYNAENDSIVIIKNLKY